LACLSGASNGTVTVVALMSVIFISFELLQIIFHLSFFIFHLVHSRVFISCLFV